MNILADNSLPGLLDAFPPPFEVTVYHHPDEVAKQLKTQEILLCRSTLTVDKTILSTPSLRFVATASSGIDHIDLSFLNTQPIDLLDAKGSNAAAVADYVVATVAYLKNNDEFRGKNVGVIGMGAVGKLVAQRLHAIGLEVVGFDPLKECNDTNFPLVSLQTILACDLICIHANLHDHSPYPSRNLLAEKELAKLKPHTVIINAARGGIVSEKALLTCRVPLVYCTDVFSSEPAINSAIVDFSRLCTPHIAGHSVEAKRTAVTLISQKLHAAYKLRLPRYSTFSPISAPLFFPEQSWEEQVLSLYNPIHETMRLKEALNLRDRFIQIRKMHHFRHDFCTYDQPLAITDKNRRAVFGLA